MSEAMAGSMASMQSKPAPVMLCMDARVRLSVKRREQALLFFQQACNSFRSSSVWGLSKAVGEDLHLKKALAGAASVCCGRAVYSCTRARHMDRTHWAVLHIGPKLWRAGALLRCVETTIAWIFPAVTEMASRSCQGKYPPRAEKTTSATTKTSDRQYASMDFIWPSLADCCYTLDNSPLWSAFAI